MRVYDRISTGRGLVRKPSRRITKRSKSELRLEEHMRKWNIPFVAQVPIKTWGGTFVVDFLVGKKCVVECEGRVHQKRLLADNVRETFIADEGFTVIRLPNFQIFDLMSECLRKIRLCLESEAH